MQKTSSQPKKVLIVGANSAIAQEVARIYAAQGCELFLIARDEGRLSVAVSDLKVRGAAKVAYGVLDVNNAQMIEPAINAAISELGRIDVALIAHGSLPDQKACEESSELTLREIHINGTSPIMILFALSKQFMRQGEGTIVAISSVAGDRGRSSNYVYGTAKAMLSTYLQGLRGHLYEHNVHVIDVKPGFVDTPMTAQFKKGALWATPQQVAGIIVKSVEKKKHTVYAPFFWRFIMIIIRAIPDAIFKKLKF